MQRKYNDKQIKDLKKFHKMLVSMSNDTFRGAVLSSKQLVLGRIYDEIAENRCSSCNNNWIYRMANWYVNDLKIIESNKKKVVKSKKKKVNDKKGDK